MLSAVMFASSGSTGNVELVNCYEFKFQILLILYMFTNFLLILLQVFQLTYIGNARVGEVWIDGFAVNAARMCPFTRAPGWKPLFPAVPSK